MDDESLIPLCVHSHVIDGIQKCLIDLNVVRCCGKCFNTCHNYKKMPIQLDLFNY